EVHEQPGRPVEVTLVGQLRERTLLLVLDNCEHLVAAAAGLADALLRGCPGVRLLATSREVLGIGGETTYAVPPLGLPPAEPGRGPDTHRPPVDPARDACGEAMRLFAERARAVLPSFELGPDNPAAVAA